MSSDDVSVSPDQLPDLHVVLNRLQTDADKQAFLENLHTKISKHSQNDGRVQPYLKQVAMLLVPLYERERRWNDAGILLEEAGLYSQAISDYMRGDQFGGAARCAENNGDLKNALSLFVKAQMFIHAVAVAQKLGDTAQAESLAKRAIEFHGQRQEYKKAAFAAEQAGLVKEALLLEADQIDHIGYQDSKYMYQELVERALKANLVELGLSLALRGTLFERGLEIAQQCKLLDRVPEIYRQFLDSVYPKERTAIFRGYVEFLVEHATQAVVKAAYSKEVTFLKNNNEFLLAANLAEEARLPEKTALYQQAMQEAETKADFAMAALAATKLGLAQEAEFYRNLATMFG